MSVRSQRPSASGFGFTIKRSSRTIKQVPMKKGSEFLKGWDDIDKKSSTVTNQLSEVRALVAQGIVPQEVYDKLVVSNTQSRAKKMRKKLSFNDKPVIEGHLFLKVKSRFRSMKFRKLYFTLYRSKLVWKKKKSAKTIISSIVLTSKHQVQDWFNQTSAMKHTFKVSNQKNTLFFAADSATLKNYWMEVLSSTFKKLGDHLENPDTPSLMDSKPKILLGDEEAKSRRFTNYRASIISFNARPSFLEMRHSQSFAESARRNNGSQQASMRSERRSVRETQQNSYTSAAGSRPKTLRIQYVPEEMMLNRRSDDEPPLFAVGEEVEFIEKESEEELLIFILASYNLESMDRKQLEEVENSIEIKRTKLKTEIELIQIIEKASGLVSMQNDYHKKAELLARREGKQEQVKTIRRQRLQARQYVHNQEEKLAKASASKVNLEDEIAKSTMAVLRHKLARILVKKVLGSGKAGWGKSCEGVLRAMYSEYFARVSKDREKVEMLENTLSDLQQAEEILFNDMTRAEENNEPNDLLEKDYERALAKNNDAKNALEDLNKSISDSTRYMSVLFQAMHYKDERQPGELDKPPPPPSRIRSSRHPIVRRSLDESPHTSKFPMKQSQKFESSLNNSAGFVNVHDYDDYTESYKSGENMNLEKLDVIKAKSEMMQ